MPNTIGNQPDVADAAAQPGFDADPLELVDTPENIDADLPETESETPPRSDDDEASKFPDAPPTK